MSSYYLFNGNPVTLAYPVGGVFPYLGTSSAPSGYVLCDGASYNRFIYADLFAVIGYTYGGSNENFNVPDYRSRSLQGYNSSGSNSFTTEYSRASTDYDQTITIPTHSHNYYSNQFATFDGNASRTGLSGSTSYSHKHKWYFYHNAGSHAQLINTGTRGWVRARHHFNTGSYMSQNPGSYLGNRQIYAMFYEDSDQSPALDSPNLFKTGTNTDGTHQSAAGGGSSNPTLNTAPHETRVNYIMNYGNLSNIEDALHIYSTDNTNYTEYTYNGDAYAIFDMTSNDSYFYMEFDSGLDADLKTYLENNLGAHLLMVGGGGAGGGTTNYLGGGGGAGALGISTSFNLPAEKTIYGKIGKGGVNGTSYSETHETTSQTYTGEEGHGSDTILYIDGAMVGYAQGGGSGQDDTISDTSARWGGCAGGYSGTYTAQGSSNLSLSGAESSSATNVLSNSTYGNISFQGNTNGASSDGYWASYPSFWWRGGTGGGGADSAGMNFAGGPYGASTRSVDGTNGGGAYTWIDGLEYAGGGGGGGNGIGGGGGAGDGGVVASTVASSTALLNSGADGQNATIANRGSGGGGGFTGGSGSDGVIKIAIPRDYILSVTQIPLGGLQIFTTHSGSPGLSWSGADNNTVRTYNGTSYTFFYFTDAQAETTTGTSGGGQGNQNNHFFIGTDPTLTPQQTTALNKMHGVEMLLIGAGGNGGYCGHRRGDSNPQGCGGGGGGAGGMGIVHNGNLPTNEYIKFLIGQQGDTSGKYASNSAYVNRGYYEASDSTESNRRDRRSRTSVMQVGTTESNVSTIATAYMGGDGAGVYSTYGQNSGGYYQSGWITYGNGYQDGASAGGSTGGWGSVGSGTGGADNTNGTYGTWNFYANSGGGGSSGYGFNEVGGGGGAGGAGGSATGLGGDGKAWIDGNTYCTGGGGTAGSNLRNQNTSRNGGSSNIHSNESAYVQWTGETSWVNQSDGDPGPSNSGSGGGARRQYLQSTSGFSNMDGAATGQGGSGLAVIAIPTSLIGNIYDYDTYNVIPTGFLEIKYTGFDVNVTESTTTHNGVGYTIFELPETGYTQQLSIGFKSGITALEKYKVLSDGLRIPFIAVGGGSSGEGLTGSPSGAGGSAGAVVYGSYDWNSILTMSNVFEFVCNVGTGGAGSLSGNGRNAGGDTTIDLSGGYGLERYIDASGGEVDGSVGLATIKSLTHYGNNELNIELTSDNLPIAHYEFNSNSGDSSFQGNDLTTFTGGYATPISTVPYTYGTFTNQLATTPPLLTSLPITVCCWFQKITSGIQSIFSFNNTNDVYLDNSNRLYCSFYLGNNWVNVGTSYSISTGYIWHHVAITVDTAYNLKLYVNDSLASSNSGNGTFSSTSDGVLHIASKWDNNQKLTGHIGDLRVYNKALSSSEISDIYDGTQVNYSGVIKNADYTKGADSLSYTGAGGAGAGGNGNDAEQTIGGAGGQGILWGVEGYYYGAGGGGGGSSGGGAGGNSIGGEGADVNSTGTGEDQDARSATANRGSGGGGGVNGAAGSSGVVKFAIPTSYIRTGGIGAHENSIATSNYLKIQTSGTVTEVTYNNTDYYLLDFQASSNLTTTTHYFKLGFVDDANDATLAGYDGTNYSEDAYCLCVAGGGAGGYGSGRDWMPYTSSVNSSTKQRYGIRVGGGGGAGGYVEGSSVKIPINKLFTITVGAGGSGTLSNGSGGVTAQQNKGADSRINLEGVSNPIVESQGGGVGMLHGYDDSNYSTLSQGGSGGGKITGFQYGYVNVFFGITGAGWRYFYYYDYTNSSDYNNNAVNLYARNTGPMNDTNSSSHTIWSNQVNYIGKVSGTQLTSPGSSTTTSYGTFVGYGYAGGQRSAMYNFGNNDKDQPYTSSLGGGGAGGTPWQPSSGYTWNDEETDVRIAYGGQARQWIDGSWYAGGGGGATMSPVSFIDQSTSSTSMHHIIVSEDNQIQQYGTGGGSADTGSGNTNFSSSHTIIGGSGIRVMNAVIESGPYRHKCCFMYAGYNDNYTSYQSNISRDGTAGTGSGGGGGFAHTIAEANELMYHGGYTSSSSFSTAMFGPNRTNQGAILDLSTVYEGFNGSGGSGRVKIAIPKQINGVNIILASAQDTNYTGT